MENRENAQIEERFSTTYIAESLGYSRQRIGQAMKLLDIEAEKGRKGYRLTKQQANQIAEFLEKRPLFDIPSTDIQEEEESEVQAANEEQPPTNSEDDSKLIDELKNEIEDLKQQLAAKEEKQQEANLAIEIVQILKDDLEKKNSQIAALNERLAEANASLKESQDQISTLLDTNKALSASSAANDVKELMAVNEQPKKGFWARLFGK